MPAPDPYRSLEDSARSLGLDGLRIHLARAVDEQHPRLAMNIGTPLVDYMVVTYLAFNWSGESELEFESSLPDCLGNFVLVGLRAVRGLDGEFYVRLKKDTT